MTTRDENPIPPMPPACAHCSWTGCSSFSTAQCRPRHSTSIRTRPPATPAASASPRRGSCWACWQRPRRQHSLRTHRLHPRRRSRRPLRSHPPPVVRRCGRRRRSRSPRRCFCWRGSRVSRANRSYQIGPLESSPTRPTSSPVRPSLPIRGRFGSETSSPRSARRCSTPPTRSPGRPPAGPACWESSRSHCRPDAPGFEPTRDALAELPDAARSGLEPVTSTTQKAFARLLRDVGGVQVSTRPKS